MPVYERLGDAREAAVTKGKIADILQIRGDLDGALRIRREEELPVYERLGDARAAAVTKGKIADILQIRGDLDGALRIRREEELPVFERLGDARSAAVTKGQIADILQMRGDLDGALRIRREEELPVYERLGDARSLAAVSIGEDRRRCSVPAPGMVYDAIALALYMGSSRARCCAVFWRGCAGCGAPRRSGWRARVEFRRRAGARGSPLRRLCEGLVQPIATPASKGAWARDWRLVSLDGSCLEVADTAAIRSELACPEPVAARALSRNCVSRRWWRMARTCCSAPVSGLTPRVR